MRWIVFTKHLSENMYVDLPFTVSRILYNVDFRYSRLAFHGHGLGLLVARAKVLNLFAFVANKFPAEASGQQDAGHEGVVTRCDALSLRSFFLVGSFAL